MLLGRFSMNLRWTYIGITVIDGISPGMERFCDIGHVISPRDRNRLRGEAPPSSDPNATILHLDLEAEPNHLPHLVKPGQYRLNLLITASNAVPAKRILQFELTGKWSESMNEMLREGIRGLLLTSDELTDLA